MVAGPRADNALSNSSAGPPATRTRSVQLRHFMDEADLLADARQQALLLEVAGEGAKIAKRRQLSECHAVSCLQKLSGASLTGVNVAAEHLLVYCCPCGTPKTSLFSPPPGPPCCGSRRSTPLSLAGAALVRTLTRRHPSLFARLGEQAEKTFLIDPTDLPFAFRLAPHPSTGRASRRCGARTSGHWDARIGGPLAALLGLVHGVYDGDALFFSRDLVIEGDTEAVLALRNAIDNEEIDLAAEAARAVRAAGASRRTPGAARSCRARAPATGVALTRAERAFRHDAQTLELVCPAGTPAAFASRSIDAGAHAVYCGFDDETNARNFPGLNFSPDETRGLIAYAHKKGAKTLVAINTFPRAGAVELWHKRVDDAARLKADAVILADIGLLDYASKKHPNLRLHLSVQAAAANSDAI